MRAKREQNVRGLGKPETEARALIDRLEPPEPWHRMRFIESIAKARNRSITLMPVDATMLANSPCGLWLVREHDDIILYEDGTSEYHADQIILHELGHMLLGHDKSVGTSVKALMLTRLTPHLDSATVKAALGRSDYHDDQEREAEMFASLMMVRRSEAAAAQPTIQGMILGHR